ncbi:Prephenate and/or arogenate dehydrogenase (undetermined specificity) [Mucinivorans hirudinis]|uniref:Prephenate and/or arogenate dehydrogenase (Undetermined specificity) n=1 Tax=Mucinivorans hirudinis TaxID=1433126 RepID=A0A060RBF7_9BACT|nr:Prephenate and/or arogenate dehydrogenase (undetermined specificity) [Mucinivorans hirudinis]
MTTTIIGTGLIGGSFAIALREKGLADHIIGVDSSATNRARAKELGLVDETLPLDEAIAKSDLIVLAIPVNHIPLESIKILNNVDKQIVMDMGSTKEELCSIISQHPKRGRFVATHPMWGTERSGPDSAVQGAFAGRVTVICERERSDSDALQAVEKIYTALGMPIKYMEPEEHDMHTAYISHISHITSYALALTVLEKERENEQIFDLASAGFSTTVRLAKSSPAMWAAIFIQNKYNVLDVLRENIHQLNIIRKMLENDDYDGLYRIIEKANTISKII